jgi:uroporphyrinogen-III synthase
LEPLCERLRTLGAEPIRFPVIAVAAPTPGGELDQAMSHLTDYDWIIFTSVNGVEQFWARLASVLGKGVTRTDGIPNFRGKIAAIGPATAAALEQRRTRVHLMPGEYRAEAILEAIGDVNGLRILLPRADIARADLAHGLRERGARVDEVPAYRTVPATPPPQAFEALGRGVDIITFTSSSTVRNFVALTRGVDCGDPLIACIGPVTADTARQLGLRVDVVAEEYTVDGLIEALTRLWIDNPAKGVRDYRTQ